MNLLYQELDDFSWSLRVSSREVMMKSHRMAGIWNKHETTSQAHLSWDAFHLILFATYPDVTLRPADDESISGSQISTDNDWKSKRRMTGRTDSRSRLMDFHWIRGSSTTGDGRGFDKATPRPRNPIELRTKSQTEGITEIFGISIRGVDFP